MSGVAGRSGRKSNAEIARARELIAAAVSDADWRAIFKALADAGKEGNEPCVALLMKYAFGLPTQFVAGDDDAPPISIVEYTPTRAATRARRTRKVNHPPASRSTARA